jgi:hypothetical protein
LAVTEIIALALCGRMPKASVISSMVAPSGLRSISTSRSFLSVRGWSGFLTRLAAGFVLAFLAAGFLVGFGAVVVVMVVTPGSGRTIAAPDDQHA